MPKQRKAVKYYPTYGRRMLRRQIRGLRKRIFNIKKTGAKYDHLTDIFPGYLNQMDALADRLLDDVYYVQKPRKRDE